MQKWYNELAKGQKTFVYILAVIIPFVLANATNSGGIFLATLPPLALLIYLQLGSRK